MSLIIHDTEIVAEKNVTILSSASSVEMYGTEIWRGYTPTWVTLFSGSRKFTQEGSMTVVGIKPGDTVSGSAQAEFMEYVDDEEYAQNSNIITRKNLPAMVEYYAYVYLTVGQDRIDFSFHEYYEPYKGADVVYVPMNITITEVRVKR